MDLKDFVAQTLIQIVQGAASAAEEVSRLGGAVAPPHSSRPDNGLLGLVSDGSSRHAQAVRFDVAIVAERDSTTKGGVGLKVMSILEAGGSASEEDRRQHTSRVQFVVPLALPIDPVSHSAATTAAERSKREVDAALRGAGRSIG